MLSITLGPLALPAGPLLLLLGMAVAATLAGRLAARAQAPADAGETLWHAALAGLLAARLVHLAQHAAAYAEAPWSALDLRDGGWEPVSGTIVAALWLIAAAARRPALRRPLGGGALAGVALWLVGTAALGRFERPALPALALPVLDAAAPQPGQAERPPVALATLAAGRPLVLNLWASWCGPCREEMPLLAAAQRRTPGVAFVFINQRESAAAVRAYLVDQDLSLQPVLLDAQGAAAAALGSRGLPTTVFFDHQGRQVDAHLGVLNAAALQARLQRLQARGTTPPPTPNERSLP